MIKHILIFISSLLLSAGVLAEERKAVFDLTSGDPERIEGRIIETIKGLHEHYASIGIEFKPVVVISGNAYKYFIRDLDNSPFKEDGALAALQPQFETAFTELHTQYNVRFDMCGTGMKARKIDASTLYPFVNTDKSKYVYLIDWQNAGYAYIPIP